MIRGVVTHGRWLRSRRRMDRLFVEDLWGAPPRRRPVGIFNAGKRRDRRGRWWGPK